MNVLCFGEILWDHIEGKYFLGGAPLNFAAHSARFGSECHIISAVGEDDLGRRALTELERINVKTALISSVSQSTGVVEVALDNGIPSYEIVTGSAWDHIVLTVEAREMLSRTDWDLFCMGSLAQRSSANRELLHGEVLPHLKASIVFFDVNLRQNYYSRDIIERSLKFTTILKSNDEELPVISKLLYGEVLEPATLFKKMRSNCDRLDMLILTKGPRGAAIITDKGLRCFPVESDLPVVDTVGAGDAYSSSFCYAYFHTGDIPQAARFAQVVADRVVSQPGPLPDYDDAIMARSCKIAGKRHP